LKLLTSPTVKARDFGRPGHIFPLIARPGGVLVRPGHTEAAVDLSIMVGCAPVGVICEIMNADGSMARRSELDIIATTHDLKIISIADLIAYRKLHENLLTTVESVPLSTKHGEFTLHVFSSALLREEHSAIVKGDPQLLSSTTPLLRVHSECFTGDVLGSLRCDCGAQLESALSKIEAEGSGIIIYMRQEGRGIGLMNKVRAYQLQDQGLDTVDANLQLGLPADARDYTMAAQIMRHFGIKQARLLTNNPQKKAALEKLGVGMLTREGLESEPHALNRHYLQTKKTKLGHWLGHSLLNH